MAIILVSGGAGFIGSHVTDALIYKGHTVVVLDDLSGGSIDNVHPEAKIIQGNITDHQLVERLFDAYQFDYVFHLAAYAAEGLSHFIKRFNYINNVIGSVNLINESVKHRVKRFIFTSSIAVYGTNQLPMHEDLVPHPEDPYGIAKFAVEQELAATYKMFGLKYTIFRPHNVYGERQNTGDRYRNVIGIFMNQVLRGEPLTIFGDGSQRRAFSYIHDVAPIIASSIDIDASVNEKFNIGADKAYSINDLVVVIQRAFGATVNIRHLPSRHEVTDAWSDHSRLRRIFGNYNETSLEKGVQHMAEWIRQNGPRKTQPFAAIEVEQGLPSHWRDECKADDKPISRLTLRPDFHLRRMHKV